jgi:hypothetical protein
VGNHHGKGTAAPSKRTSVPQLGLDVAHNRSFWHGSQRQHIPYRKSGLLPAVHELAGVHAFRAEDQLVVLLVVVRVPELDLGDGGTATGVVQDLLDDASDVAVLLGVVIRAKLDRALAGANVRLEDRALALPLRLRTARFSNGDETDMSARRYGIRTTDFKGSFVQLFKFTYLDVFTHPL